MAGCSKSEAPSAREELQRPTFGPPAPTRPTEPLTTNEQDAARLTGELAAANARVAAEHEAKEQEHRDGIRRVVDWACSIAALVGIVGTGVAIITRSKLIALVPVAASGMVAFGETTTIILDHPWITAGGLAALIGIIAGVPALRHRAQQLASRAVPNPAMSQASQR